MQNSCKLWNIYKTILLIIIIDTSSFAYRMPPVHNVRNGVIKTFWSLYRDPQRTAVDLNKSNK